MIPSIQLREEEHLEKMIGFCAEAGYKEISISFGSTEVIFNEDYKKIAERILSMLDKNGLKCPQTHLPCYHLLVSSEVIEDKMEKAIKNAIILSSELGAKWAAYHPRTAVNDGFDRRKSFEDNKKFLEEYLEYSEKYGTGIAVENMPLFPLDRAEWRFFGSGYEDIIELCDNLKSDKIGICWDFGHAHIARIDQTYALRQIGNRLKATHVHDNYRNGDHHLLPAQGSIEWNCIDWKNLMPVMKEINYSGLMALETITPDECILKSFINQGYDSISYLCRLANERSNI